ncbi:MAG: response regulator transcription factor [Aggregatilineales bacterium]
MSGERILVIEDEARIAQFIERGLIYEGYRVTVARDGKTGLAAARDNPPDLVILDWMLPGIDGLEVCKRLRAASEVPILMLTAKDDVSDRVTGLDAGADDYLVKPFSVDELLARIRALFRRTAPASRPDILRFSDLTLDTGTHRAYRGERAIDLTAKEYELLELFMRNPRQVLTRDVIFDRVWDYDFGGESNIIEVYVRYLRQKTEAENEPRLIHTVRGVGYVLREE